MDISVSNESLPPEQSRCPRCNTVHDFASSRIPDRPRSKDEDIGRAVLAKFYEEQLGSKMTVVHLRCPSCQATYEVTQGLAQDGAEALNAAIQTGDAKALAALLQGGVAPDGQDDAGNTPLHKAAYKQSRECCEVLFIHGADPKARNRNNQTPLEYLLDFQLRFGMSMQAAFGGGGAQIARSKDKELHDLVCLLKKQGSPRPLQMDEQTWNAHDVGGAPSEAAKDPSRPVMSARERIKRNVIALVVLSLFLGAPLTLQIRSHQDGVERRAIAKQTDTDIPDFPYSAFKKDWVHLTGNFTNEEKFASPLFVVQNEASFFTPNGYEAWTSVTKGTKNIAESRTIVYVIRRGDNWMSICFVDRKNHNRKRIIEAHDMDLEKALKSVSE